MSPTQSLFDLLIQKFIIFSRRFPALSVFVMPPSIGHLEERLRNRSTESERNLQKRVEKAEHELTYAEQFDVVIVNDDLDLALMEAKDVVKDFINS